MLRSRRKREGLGFWVIEKRAGFRERERERERGIGFLGYREEGYRVSWVKFA